MSDMKTLTIGAQTWSIPVTSVNGQTGAVVLDAEDVGAATSQDIADAIIQVLPVDSASGAVASFPDGYPAPVEALTAAITPVQDLHGQSSPYPPGGGKNLLNNTATSGTVNHLTYTTNSDGSIKVSGTATAGTTIILWGGGGGTPLFYLEAGQTYVMKDGNFQINGTTAKGAMDSPITYTASEGDFVSFFWLYFTNGQEVNKTYYPQFEKGSTPTSFAPYSNICPITGWSEAKVTRTGINVWDEQWEIGSINNTTGVDEPDATNIRGKTYISVKPSTSYYFYIGVAKNLRIYWYDSQKSFISSQTAQNQAYSSPSNAYYLRVRSTSSYGDTYNNDISVNYPSTDNAYHAHSIQTVTIDLSGTRYGGTLDVLTGVLTVTTMLWAAPSDNWSSITRPDGRTIYYHDLPAETIDSGIASDRPYSVSDTFGYISSPVYNWYSVIGDCEYIYNVAGISANKRVWIRYESNDFATAINGAKFVFLLQTPLSVQLTPAELETILGQNNIWANCGDVAVSYRADIQRYIEKKLS